MTRDDLIRDAAWDILGADLCRTDTDSWLSIRPRRHSDLGCAWGLAMLAVRLDERWGTGHWGNPRYATKGDEG